MSDEQIDAIEGEESVDDSGDSGQPDANEELYAKIRNQVIDDVVRELAEERTDSPIYKGIQRVVSRKDRELMELRNSNSALDAQFRSLSQQFNDAVESFNYSTKVLYDNLPDNEKQRVVQEMNAMTQRRMQSRLDQLTQQQRQPQQDFQQPPSELVEALERARDEADQALRETVTEFGLDPHNGALDYGEREEPFATRLKKLNKSMVAIRKEQKEQAKADVKPKVKPEPTRTGIGSGDNNPEVYGLSTLQRGSRALLEQARSRNFR